MRRPTKHMLRRWWEQKQLCVWCGAWCWASTVLRVDEARKMLAAQGIHGRKQVRHRRATADHIVPVSWGGGNVSVNIVCACAACNVKRGNNPAALKPHLGVIQFLPEEVRTHILRTIDSAVISH